MFTMRQFFAPLNHKYLGSTMKNIENSRTILSIYNLFWKQHTSHWIILKRLRATTVIRPRDMRVANNDLSVFIEEHRNTQSWYCLLWTRNGKLCTFPAGAYVNFIVLTHEGCKNWHLFINELVKFANPNRISNHSNNLVRYLKTNRRVVSGKTRYMGVRAKIERVLKLKSPREIIKTIG